MDDWRQGVRASQDCLIASPIMPKIVSVFLGPVLAIVGGAFLIVNDAEAQNVDKRHQTEEKSQDYLRLTRASTDNYFTLRCETLFSAYVPKAVVQPSPITKVYIITIDLNSMSYKQNGSHKKRIIRVTDEKIILCPRIRDTYSDANCPGNNSDFDNISNIEEINRTTGEYFAVASGETALITDKGTCHKIGLIPFGARKF